MTMRILLFLTLISFGSCALMDNLFGTKGPSRNYFKEIVGMTLEQVKKTIGSTPKEMFKVSPNITLYGFEDGFVVVDKGVISEAHPYRILDKFDTINTLVTLGMGPIDIIKNAGWPLKIQTTKNVHVFYYRTGTLLIKDDELVNTFNRNEDYGVSVSAYKGKAIKNPVYYIIPSVPTLDRNSLEFIEVKDYIQHLVVLDNARYTENLAEANVLLFVHFGVGDKEVDIMSYSTPIYRSVYHPGSTTTSNVQNSYGNTVGTLKTTTSGSYSTQYAGQSTSQYKIETYRRHLILEAIDAKAFKANGEKKYFWKVITESVGSTADFRAILPVLSYGTQGYFYKNTGKAVNIRIDFDQMMNFFLEIFSK